MATPSHDPSIENEPHLRLDPLQLDPSEQKAQQVLARQASRSTEHDAVDHVVWDEPNLSAELAGGPDESQLTYERWLTKNIAATNWSTSWLVVLGIAIIAGPWAIVATLFTPHDQGGVTATSILLVSVFGPLIEEFMKIAATLWVVEKRPFWFKSIAQVMICAVAGGIMFGVIENLIYLNAYIPNPGRDLSHWRWTVCVGLHMNCSFLAGVGLARVWDNCIREKHRPRLWMATPWFFTAILGHGLYNFAVMTAEMSGWLEFNS